MNRIKKELLAIRIFISLYLRYHKNPSEFYEIWRNRQFDTDLKIWERECWPGIKKFKNLHEGKDCFIMGNGPSLNQMELEKLNDYYTFGLNKIYLIFKRVELELDFLVAVNHLVIKQSVEEFRKLKIPKFISYSASKDIDRLDELTFRIMTKGGLESTGNLYNPINEGYTVTNVALQIAYFMGFQNVFLVGVDHSFQQKGKPNKTQTMKDDDVNHFDPNYFKGQKWQLADMEGSEMAYQNTKFLYDRANRNIYDATLNGKLQVFEKIAFEKALQIAHKK